MRLAAGEQAERREDQKVRYLPSLDFGLQEELAPAEGAQIMPCFPLGGGGFTYVPETEHQLNIFEPRYRQMYSDILLSGGRRFVVPQIAQDEQGVRLTEVGVVFYLDDLKEVSEQTQDQIKYQCSHKVIGRVHLRRVLNPRAFADRSTYLRVEVEDVLDADADEDLAEAEEAAMGEVVEMASLQAATKAEVQLDADRLRQRNATRGAGFWSLVNIWQGYLQARFRVLKEQFEKDLRSQIKSFLLEEGGDIPAQVSLSELPERMQRKVVALQTQFQEDSEPLVRALSDPVHLLVQSDSHRERLDLFKSMVGEEKKRLEARLALQSLFDKPED